MAGIGQPGRYFHFHRFFSDDCTVAQKLKSTRRITPTQSAFLFYHSCSSLSALILLICGQIIQKLGRFGIRKAQEKETRRIKNALFIDTMDFARPPEMSPNPGRGHHWSGNAESYYLIGDALGEGMKKMLM